MIIGPTSAASMELPSFNAFVLHEAFFCMKHFSKVVTFPCVFELCESHKAFFLHEAFFSHEAFFLKHFLHLEPRRIKMGTHFSESKLSCFATYVRLLRSVFWALTFAFSRFPICR